MAWLQVQILLGPSIPIKVARFFLQSFDLAFWDHHPAIAGDDANLFGVDLAVTPRLIVAK